MLVPSLTVGAIGTFAYIACFTSLHLSVVFSLTTGRICVIGATCASLGLGAAATRLLSGCPNGKAGRLTSCLILLIISGLVFLLLLDAIALFRM